MGKHGKRGNRDAKPVPTCLTIETITRIHGYHHQTSIIYGAVIWAAAFIPVPDFLTPRHDPQSGII